MSEMTDALIKMCEALEPLPLHKRLRLLETVKSMAGYLDDEDPKPPPECADSEPELENDGEPKFPDIGCENDCGFVEAGLGWQCKEGRACGRFIDSRSSFFAPITVNPRTMIHTIGCRCDALENWNHTAAAEHLENLIEISEAVSPPPCTRDGQRWVMLERTTPSGKTLYQCRDCERVSCFPDKVCEP